MMKEDNNISINTLLITQQEMVLIKNSDEVKNSDVYGNLFDCLEEYKKLSKKDLEQNLVFDKKARIILISAENKKTMMTNILKEWYSIKEFDIADIKVSCQLCGRSNKYIFYIRNKITGVGLHIGSDCVTKFPDITGIQQERRRLSQIQRENQQRKRKIEFEVLEGDDLEFLYEAEAKFNNFEIMLPYKLYHNIKDTLRQLNLLKNSYVKSGGKIEEVFEKYNCLKLKFGELYLAAKRHYNTVGNMLLICHKETADWLLSNHPFMWDMVAKNNGIFDVETLKMMDNINYIAKMLPYFRKSMADSDIRIEQVSGTAIFFSIRNGRYAYPIKFSIKVRKFMETVGCYCLTDLNYRFSKNDFQEISIENTKSNFENVYNSFFQVINSFGYDFIIESKTEQAYWKKMPRLEMGNRWSGNTRQVAAMYKKSEVGSFLEVISPFLLKEEKFLEKNFEWVVKKMQAGKVWISQKEKDINEQIAREARGLQRQREFLPY